MKSQEAAQKRVIEIPTYLDNLVAFDVCDIFSDWLAPGGGWFINPETKKIEMGPRSIDHNRPWIYTNPNPKMYCHFYMDGVFQHLKFVHSRCMNCWKIVVKMHTVVQLFKLYEWQKKWTNDCKKKDRFCKCGVEERPWVHYQYGGYFYNEGKEQGLMRHEQVYREMRNLFGNVSDIPGSWTDGKIEVILKRYCTEFEATLGPTDQYVRPPAADAMESHLDQCFNLSKMTPGQPPFVISHVQRRWLEFAWDRGDTTAAIFNGNKPFYRPVVTYHQRKDKEESSNVEQ